MAKSKTLVLIPDSYLPSYQEQMPALDWDRFVHELTAIHPFEDGNGRMARLLEQWFLASKLGPNAWHIPSEQYYYQNLAAYYRNVHIGFDYESVDYTRSVPFLLMLPQALSAKS
jgi:fido (protein-threonine AMPylation protein)